ncbi:MAG: nrdG [Burkholderiaceae bacterium]|nr:nrdG [Burkholderiaceae bacterium]
MPFSSTDWPGKLAAVVFVQGCPWQCAYCHNPHLQPRDETGAVSWAQVTDTLARRVSLLDAVVFSGGEPTLDPALADAIHAVRALGFQVGLHTGGAYPHRLAEILPLLDWVGFDIKAPLADYERITGIAGSGEPAFAAAQMLIESGIAHEFRTTVHPDLISEDELFALAETLVAMGGRNYVLQGFRQQGCENDALTRIQHAEYPSRQLQQKLSAMFARFALRR